MKILIANPPNIEEIEKVFDFTGKAPVFTYGENIYSPDGNHLSDDLIAHENTHMIQQGDEPAEWWKQYLKDKRFRLAEELEAYRIQYQYAKMRVKDRNRLFQFLYRIAADLSSPMYGNIITHAEAMRQIKQ